MEIALFISDAAGEKLYQPIVEEGIEWTTERRSTPGKLVFQVVKDSMIQFSEGAEVRLEVNQTPVFLGYVFSKKRNKDQIITVTAYDQMRYLKNKDTYVYENKTASEFIQMVADDFALRIGELEDTHFVIASRVEENTSLFDMIESALDITLTNTKEMFVLYDDFGKLTLKNISSMYVGEPGAYFMIDEESGENFEYTSSIDTNTYNQIKLTYDNEQTGIREIYMAKDSEHIQEWGILQYYDTLSKEENGKEKADALLDLYNKKTRNLRITNVFGDIRVRAGSMVLVILHLGDMEISHFMMVEKCKHVFQLDSHFMDVTLRGGEFLG